jgi:hypothetical protein
LRDLTQHLTTRADDSHAAPVSRLPEGHPSISGGFRACQDLVRFFASLRIKPHTPPLVRVPVNSFEFQPCGRTSQAVCLSRLLRQSPQRAIIQHTSFRVWTTRVSNPVRSPHFRASASRTVQRAAFATGVPLGIYAFHRYTENSTLPSSRLECQYPSQSRS